MPFKKAIRVHTAHSSPLKLPLLFTASVVLPALLLAYMGLQAVEDDRGQALEEQTHIARMLQDQFEGITQGAIQSLRQNAQTAESRGISIDYPSAVPIHHAFLLDDRGNWVLPNISARPQVTLSAEFKAKMAATERLEFAAQDMAQALVAYQRVAAQSKDSVEQAVALNAAARCAQKQGNSRWALQMYTAIAHNHPLAFDENGAHLATYAHLQMADLFLLNGNAPGALQALGDWFDALDRGVYPLYNGLRQALNHAEQTLLSSRLSQGTDASPQPETQAEIASLLHRLHHTREQLDFIERYGPIIAPPDFTDQIALLKTGRDSILYRSGHTTEGLYLIAVAPFSGHRFVGVHFDLKAIQTQLTASSLGEMLHRSGLRISILDDRAAVAFTQTYADAMPAVAGPGRQPIGFTIGLHAEDTASILKRYRQRRWLLFSLILLLTATIGFGGYLVTRDATREVNLSRLRSRFVANVSHELKTPLASIRLYAETLLMGRFREETERAQCAETILRESDRLSRLVDNVLDFSRIEMGRKTYRLQDENLADIAQSCLDTFRYRLQEEGFEVQADIPTVIPPVALDRDGVTEAILNLLDNAVKYSPRRKEITCRVRSTTASVILEVADRGIGIPGHEHTSIFAPYHRVESNQLNVSGAGLGLTLVKHVMEAHQGRVEVESAEGQGSTFRLVFPRRQKASGQAS